MKKISRLYKYICFFAILSFFMPGMAFAASNKEFVIVIDAGHGGKDTGAIDNNVKEKDINLGVAKELAAYIKKNVKDAKIVMTRDNDTFISLNDRAAIANKNKGNLFISIHTNSVDKSNPNRKTVAGSSVYALGLHKDQNNLQVARRENSVIELEKNFEGKYSGFDPSKDESYIIFEMAQKKNLGQSLKFANEAQKELVKTAKRGDRGVKQAGFWVLWATSMPSVLVELDFICNPNSAVYMASKKGQKNLADALGNAVKSYVKNYRDANLSSKKGNRAEVQETETGAEGTSVLTAVRKNKRMDTPPATNTIQRNVARRRRGNNAKAASSKRNVETKDIPLHSETEYLAKADINNEVSEEQESQPVKENAKKGSKKKDKKKKDKKKSDKVRVYNNKKIVISNEDAEATLVSTAPKRHKSTSGHKSKVERLSTVYKIQVLVSADDLKENNPRFCGLEPITKFKENNLYKYTYGESSSIREMEKMLKEVRKKIPDAFIISSKK